MTSRSPAPPVPAALYRQMLDFRAGFDALVLASADADGVPDASHAPFVDAPNGALYLFLSELAVHTANLMARPRASVAFVNPDGDAFARKRLVLKGKVLRIPRENDEAESALSAFAERHGKIVGLLRQLGDFHLFRFEPDDAQLVLGFGKAWRLAGDELAEQRRQAAD